ncbi:MAG: GNAT family N-acetyltransferase [Acidobacteriota bacterium]
MILKRTDSTDADFLHLVDRLDRYLADVDGDDHTYYAQFNGVDELTNVVVAYENDEAIGCGAFKRYSDAAAEVKRMFVQPEFRGRRIGVLILSELEHWAGELGFVETILETGHKQLAAVRLYRNFGYEVVPNYDQYAGIESSVCMRKMMAVGRNVSV